MSGGNEPAPAPRPAIDETAQPNWLRTGYKFFPYAAQQHGHWWVLRLNYGFPENDLYTLFVDGRAALDITAGPDHPGPLVRSIAALRPYDDAAATEPALDAETAAAVVRTVARYADYGSEHGEPGPFASGACDGMTRN